MKEIKVLIIDDSSLVHILLQKVLSEHKDLKIVGDAYDGGEGIEMVRKLSPDVIIMDIGMPKVNGLDAIHDIMCETPTPIVVFSAASKDNVDLSFKAIELGAVELIEKPFADDISALKIIIEEKLIKSIRTFADFKVIRRIKHTPESLKHINPHKQEESKERISEKPVQKDEKRPANHIEVSDQIKTDNVPIKGFPVIGIVASTGGPQTIKTLLKDLSVEEMGAGIVILQHISDGFIEGFCSWLNEESPVPVALAVEGESVRPGVIYVAPEGHHLIFDNHGKFLFNNDPPIVGIRPSADMMLSFLGKTFKERAVAVVLTGMGSDGTKGIRDIKENGGFIIAQDEGSSLIFGMPKSAIDTGMVDKVLNISQIPEFLKRLCNERFRYIA